MPSPTRQDVHIDAILTNISVARIQSDEDFIATKVFPIVPVSKQSDKYYEYDQDDWFRDDAQRRADGTESAGTEYGISTSTYSCEVWAQHKDIGPQARANADVPLNLDIDATRLVTRKLMLRQEIQWVSDFFGTSIWDTDVTGGSNFTVWSDYAGSDVFEDIEAGKEKILSTTGYMPNTLVLGYRVFRQLKHHPDIRDILKHTSSENITMDIMARLFEVDRIFVAKAVKATADEGASSQTYDFVHGKHALLMYVEPSPGLMAPSAGYTFMWTGVSQGLGTTVGITRENVPLTRGAIRIEGESAWDGKVVAADMGYFFSGAVA